MNCSKCPPPALRHSLKLIQKLGTAFFDWILSQIGHISNCTLGHDDKMMMQKLG